MEASQLASIIEEVGYRWRDPSHEPRAQATMATLQCANRFTLEAIVFAVNQQVHGLRADALLEWAGPEPAASRSTVAVVNPGNIPFVELQDFLAVLLVGHRYVGKLSSASPHLLRAFSEEMGREGASMDALLAVDMPDLHRGVDALIASGTDETICALRELAIEATIPESNTLLRGNRFSAAVIGYTESEEELDGLAEDMLLHEGLGCRSVALVWAPEGRSPDDLLDAMARFRAVFPAHRATAGSLKIPIAFHRAGNLPHAFAEDGSFLLSRGDPQVQQPCHVRWCEYSQIAEVGQWLEQKRDHIQVVVASRSVGAEVVLEGFETVAPGDAQRPALGWRQDGKDVISFLRSIQP